MSRLTSFERRRHVGDVLAISSCYATMRVKWESFIRREKLGSSKSRVRARSPLVQPLFYYPETLALSSLIPLRLAVFFLPFLFSFLSLLQILSSRG